MPTSEPMAAALAEARSALGWTSPHPAVGAVVVRDGAIVGAGHTQPPGGNHAEVEALAAAGGRAPGATVFVTLESCSHHGRTPRLHSVHGLPAPSIPCIQPCNASTRSWSLLGTHRRANAASSLARRASHCAAPGSSWPALSRSRAPGTAEFYGTNATPAGAAEGHRSPLAARLC